MNIEKALRLNEAYKSATATAEAKEIATDKAHEYIALGYTLLSAADIIMRETEKIMRVVNPTYVYKDSFDIGKLQKHLESALKTLSIRSQNLENIFFEIDSGSYDRLRGNAFELLRFVMLLYTRTLDNPKNTRMLNAYLLRLKSNGMFSDEEIAGFRMR